MANLSSISLELDELLTERPGERAGQQLRQWIGDGTLPAGKALPSERQLADRLGVSRIVVRRAFAQLEVEGLVRRSPRRARVVAPRGTPAANVLHETVALLLDGDVTQVVHGHTAPGWADFFYRGAIDGAFRAGLSVLGLPSHEQATRRLQVLKTQPPCGVVILCDPQGLQSRQEVLAAFHLGNIPVVAYGDMRDWPGCDVVVSDHAAGSAALVRWLAARGCRRPLQCWPQLDPRPSFLGGRDQGYRAACAAAGLVTLPAVEVAPGRGFDYTRAAFDREAHLWAGYLAPHLLAAEPVDALLAASDGMTMLLAAACRVLGKDPARDVTIVGYDNYWRECPEHQWEPLPPAATVDKHNYALGGALIELLRERLAGAPAAAPRLRTMSPILIPTSEPSL